MRTTLSLYANLTGGCILCQCRLLMHECYNWKIKTMTVAFSKCWSDRRPWWGEGEGWSSGYLPKRLDGVVWCTAVAHPAHFTVTTLPQLQVRRSRQSQVNCISADSIELELVKTSTHFLILLLPLMQFGKLGALEEVCSRGLCSRKLTGCKLFEYSWPCVN